MHLSLLDLLNTLEKLLAAYAAERGIGLSFNGLTPDFNNAIQGVDRCNNTVECGMYDPIFYHNRSVPIAFETYDYMLCDTSSVYWGMLSGLDKKVDFLRLNYDLFYDPVTHQDRTENLAIFDWTARYVGKTLANTPSVWVAMREHRTPTTYCYAQPETVSYYPQIGNYSYYLIQDDNVTGGRSVHLTDWPDADLFPPADDVQGAMVAQEREDVEMGHADPGAQQPLGADARHRPEP